MWQFLAAVTSHTTSIDWVLLALGVLLLIYIAGTWKYDYFQKQGLASTKPKLPFLGDNLSLFFGFRSFPDTIKDHYNNSDGRAVYGMFEFTKPVFMICDPELLKVVAVKEFDNFMNHRTVQSEKADPIFSKNLLNLKGLADEDMSAQAIIFFFAGFETVSTALCMTTHALSHNSEVMKQLQMEIDAVMEETGGKPNYETVQKMKYLEAVINEALRMYPPAVATDRICVKDIQLSGGSNPTSFIVHKGSIISIPIIGLHYDPQYWDEPEKFNPDRFNEHKNRIKPFTFMPFGVGPRICIGQRFALIEIKLVLVHLLYNFDLHPSSKTKHPLEYEPGINMIARGGFWCELTPRKL